VIGKPWIDPAERSTRKVVEGKREERQDHDGAARGVDNSTALRLEVALGPRATKEAIAKIR
jgi:hypothetical protein